MIRAAEFEIFGEPSIRRPLDQALRLISQPSTIGSVGRLQKPSPTLARETLADDAAWWRMLVKERNLTVPQ
jgi:hypothetical protein